MKAKKFFYSRETRTQIRKRTAFILLFFFVGFGVLTYRCLYLHLVPDHRLERLTQRQYQAVFPKVPPRGTIYDVRGEAMALSVPTLSLAVRPSHVMAPHDIAKELSKILSLPMGDLFSKLTAEKKYVWIKRHLAPNEASVLKTRELTGLEWVNESKRFYPNRELASQILGAVGVDGEPLGGIELAYQGVLVSEDPQEATYRDARGQTFEMPHFKSWEEGPDDLWLTLNKSIQYITETELGEVCEKYHAKACTGIVMDPHTGSILAMASVPTFNPNAFQEYNWSRWKNRAVTDGFEPGSIFKVILAAAALESGTVRPDDRFFCENGSLKIGNHIIHDHSPYGLMTFREILKVSSNIGFFKIGQRVGKEEFSKTIRALGFGKKTGIDFPGEEGGLVRPISDWQEIDFANMSFGQGIRVTPLQIIRAFAVLASGGLDVHPHFVSKVSKPDGRVIWQAESNPRRVLKESTVKTLTQMLTEVTEEGGTGVQAHISGYSVAGKTGTAQKLKGGQYSHTDFMSSFIGFAPAESPRVVVLVVVDEPRGEIYGGTVAAPAFRNIAWSALRELGVPPQSDFSPPVMKQAELSPFGWGNADLIKKAEAGEEGVPDFRGLSMREVLSLLEQHKIPAELEGSGVAYAQRPLPGSLLEKGQVCRVSFRSVP